MINSSKEFISLEDDLLFKEALSHKDNREALIDLLATFTNFSKEYLSNVNLKVTYETYLDSTKYKAKRLRGVVIIEFDNVLLNMECYSSFKSESFLKSESYLMRLFSNVYTRGEEYRIKKYVYQISFIDNVHCEFDNNIKSTYGIINEKNSKDKKLNDILICKYYRLDRARGIPYNETDRKLRWLKFIGAKSKQEREEIAKGDEIMENFDNWLSEYVNDDRTKAFYEEWSEDIAKDHVKDKYRQIGRDEGIDIGREQGIDIGREGVAQELIKKGMSDKDVSEVTSVPLKKVKALKAMLL